MNPTTNERFAVISDPKVLMPCPVCHALPIPKGHAHYGPELVMWRPAQPPFAASQASNE